MRVEYELKFRDYLLFNALHQLLSIPVQATYLVFSGFLFLLVLEHGVCAALVAGAAAYAAMWAFQLAFNVIYLYSSKNKSLLTRHSVEIQDNAFLVETKFNRSYHYWTGVQQIVRRPGFVAVYLNAHVAHIIPARAFATKAEALRFVALARGHLNAA